MKEVKFGEQKIIAGLIFETSFHLRMSEWANLNAPDPGAPALVQLLKKRPW